MARSETVERILDTAQQLFAEKGFSETTLRVITAKAGVNLASVNYHFGSKEALIEAVFVRFLGPFCKRLECELERGRGQSVSLEELLETLVEQALFVARNGRELAAFMRLFGMAVQQNQRQLRIYLQGLYGKTMRRFLQHLYDAVPDVPPFELFMRVRFMLGAAAFSMAGEEVLREIVRVDFGVNSSPEQVLRLLVPFMVAGMRADSALSEGLAMPSESLSCD